MRHGTLHGLRMYPSHSSSFLQCKSVIIFLLVLVYTILLSFISNEGERVIPKSCSGKPNCDNFRWDEHTSSPAVSACSLVFIVGFILVIVIVRFVVNLPSAA